MTSTGIVVDGVARSFGAVHAVTDARFTAHPGRITGLVGPNGAGKTTLMLMLASLLQPDRGTISVGGVSPAADPAAARTQVGWMPDGLGAWPALTVRETLVFTGRLCDLDKAAASTRADELIRTVRLEELAQRPARVLSRGQKQRLGLARALVHRPSVLILDEPASGLDPQARIDLRELLRGFAAAGGTVLISSHVLSELDELVDDAVFMRAGAIVDAPADSDQGINVWRIRTLEPDVESARVRIAGALALHPAQVPADRGAVLLSCTSEASAAEALTRLTAAGIAVVEFAPTVGRLERAFLSLEDAR